MSTYVFKVDPKTQVILENLAKGINTEIPEALLKELKTMKFINSADGLTLKGKKWIKENSNVLFKKNHPVPVLSFYFSEEFVNRN